MCLTQITLMYVTSRIDSAVVRNEYFFIAINSTHEVPF